MKLRVVAELKVGVLGLGSGFWVGVEGVMVQRL